MPRLKGKTYDDTLWAFAQNCVMKMMTEGLKPGQTRYVPESRIIMYTPGMYDWLERHFAQRGVGVPVETPTACDMKITLEEREGRWHLVYVPVENRAAPAA